MKWPWRMALDALDAKIAEDEERRERIRAQWPKVHLQASQSRYHYSENHIIDHIVAIARGVAR